MSYTAWSLSTKTRTFPLPSASWLSLITGHSKFLTPVRDAHRNVTPLVVVVLIVVVVVVVVVYSQSQKQCLLNVLAKSRRLFNLDVRLTLEEN